MNRKIRILAFCTMASPLLWAKPAAATWQVIFGGEQISTLKPKDCPEDYTEGMIILSDGSYVVGGQEKNCKADITKLVSEHKLGSVWLARIKADGSPVWFRYPFFQHPEAFEGIPHTPVQMGIRISAAAADGGFYLGGTAGSSSWGKKGVLIKFDSEGQMNWEKFYSGKDFCRGACNYEEPFISYIQTQPDGDLLGIVMVSEAGAGYPVFLVRFSNAGAVKSIVRLPELQYFPNTASPSGDGGIVIAKTTFYSSNERLHNDVDILRYDSNGRLLWKKTYGKPGIEEIPDRIMAMSDGGYALGVTEMGSQNKAWIFKINGQGDKIWETYHSSASSEGTAGMAESPEGDVVLLLDGYEGNFTMQKLQGTTGQKLWSKKHAKRKVTSTSLLRASTDGYVISGYTKGRPAIVTDGILIKTDWEGNLSKDAPRKNFP